MSTLKVDGKVARPCEISFQDLCGVEPSLQIADVTQLGARRPGQAIKLSALLSLVGIEDSACFIGLHASRDDFHASIPLEDQVMNAVIVYGNNGVPLGADAGGPFRFFIPDHAACKTDEIDECANVKFLDHLEFTTQRGFDNRPKDEAEHEKLHQNEHQS